MAGDEKKRVNMAYVDAANLDKALKNHLGWKMDYKRFRVWLAVLSPSPVEKCSILIKRIGVPIAYINDQRSILEYKGRSTNKKAPDADGTA